MENSNKAKNMDTERTSGVTALLILVDGRTTILMVMESTNGQMADPMMAVGLTTNFMERASILGLMAENTKANMLTIKRKVSVFITGQTARDMKVSGATGSNMEKERQSMQKENAAKAFGKMANV